MYVVMKSSRKGLGPLLNPEPGSSFSFLEEAEANALSRNEENPVGHVVCRTPTEDDLKSILLAADTVACLAYSVTHIPLTGQAAANRLAALKEAVDKYDAKVNDILKEI